MAGGLGQGCVQGLWCILSAWHARNNYGFQGVGRSEMGDNRVLVLVS